MAKKQGKIIKKDEKNDNNDKYTKDQLIDLVEENECLYNTQMKEYRQSTIRNEKWNEIAERLGANVKEVKNKWKNIRAGYYNSKKKPASGSGVGRKRQATRDLSFLKDFGVAEEGFTRESSFPVSLIIQSPFDASEDSNLSSQGNKTVDMEESDFETDMTDKSVSVADDVRIEIDVTDDQKGVLKQMDEIIKSITHEREKEPDGIDLFCDSLKEDLRLLDKRRLLICKAQILNVISDNLSDSGT